MTSLRVAVFGTPSFAVPTLDALHASAHSVVTVVTQPDRPRGRGQKIVPSPMKARALELDIPVFQPDRLRDDSFATAFDALGADIGVVAAYGKLLPQRLIDAPRLGMINVHASLLPRWRGAAPIHRAVMAGDPETGITIMRVVQALDAGPILARVTLGIGDDETSAELESRLAAAGARLLVEMVDRLSDGPIVETPQDETGVTYAHRLERRESQLNWDRPAAGVHNQIRGLHPWPLAAAVIGGTRVKLMRSTVATPASPESASAWTQAIHRPGTIVSVDREGLVVATAPGFVRIVELQPAGKGPMSVRDFLNGHPLHAGDRFDPLPAGT